MTSHLEKIFTKISFPIDLFMGEHVIICIMLYSLPQNTKYRFACINIRIEYFQVILSLHNTKTDSLYPQNDGLYHRG